SSKVVFAGRRWIVAFCRVNKHRGKLGAVRQTELGECTICRAPHHVIRASVSSDVAARTIHHHGGTRERVFDVGSRAECESRHGTDRAAAAALGGYGFTWLVQWRHACASSSG